MTNKENTKMRTSIRGEDNRATLKFTDADGYESGEGGTLVTWEFSAPSTGGYVEVSRSTEPRAEWGQVCEFLYDTGDTLRWHPGNGPLVKLVRREWRKRLAREKRVLDRFSGLR